MCIRDSSVAVVARALQRLLQAHGAQCRQSVQHLSDGLVSLPLLTVGLSLKPTFLPFPLVLQGGQPASWPPWRTNGNGRNVGLSERPTVRRGRDTRPSLRCWTLWRH